ncbi:hypothetical protein CN090_11980 [Sinorhizobium meliloti]|nr:hypothetical protein CN120_17080 [Sinorhizobium meliloti]RVN56331.1 hypothetical protein CN108_12180 [Sinorhizobium meliloti]RVN70555.1 hypothetical protein CN104_02545 [Sinorhizobium meliloti]RVO26614.1 hypothetical protein CN100_04095 [Sinorhizobium meliloti]RVO51262.1 hypothetical protein CN090_11980 [Sinorhizobium meliloti]
MFSGRIDLTNVIDSKKLARDAGGKPHPLSSFRPEDRHARFLQRAFSHEPADARRLLHGGRHHGGASKCENVPVARKEPLHAKRVMNRQHLARSPLLVITASAFGS